MLKYLYLISIFLLLFSASFDKLYAQRQDWMEEVGEIDISPAELQSLVERLQILKRERIRTFRKEQLMIYSRNHAQFQRRGNTYSDQLFELEKKLIMIQESLRHLRERQSLDNDLKLLKPEIDDLERSIKNELELLKSELAQNFQQYRTYQFEKSDERKFEIRDSIKLQPLKEELSLIHIQLDSIWQRLHMVSFPQMPESKDQIDSVKLRRVNQSGSDTLRIIESVIHKYPSEDIIELKALVSDLYKQLEFKEEQKKNETFLEDSIYASLKGLIADKQQTSLYYRNNVFQLSGEQQKRLDQIAELLDQNPRLDIYVIGFASESGSPSYNQTLSQLRAETIKKYFMKKGLHPYRIYTEFHGIDYQVSQNSDGRRTDLILLINKSAFK